MPGGLAGIDVERHRRVGVEVVPGARLRIVDRERVARADDVELGRRIVGAGLPDAAAAGLPGVVVVFPGLAARVAGLRHDVPAPQFLAGPDLERRDPSARSAVARAVLDDDLAVGDQRSRKKFFLSAEFGLAGDHLVPHDLAVVAVDRDDPSVRQVGDHELLPESDAARARDVALMLHARIAYPDEFSLAGIARVDLVDGAPAVARVHETVVDERIDLVFRAVLPDVLHAAQRHRPDEPQVLDVVAVDLGELRITRGAVVAVHQQPVLRLVLRIDQTVPVDGHLVLGGERRRRKRDGRYARETCELDPGEFPRVTSHDLIPPWCSGIAGPICCGLSTQISRSATALRAGSGAGTMSLVNRSPTLGDLSWKPSWYQS